MGSSKACFSIFIVPRRLVQDGIIAEDAVTQALQASRTEPGGLVPYLVSRKLANARQIAIAAATEFGVPLLDLEASAVQELEPGCAVVLKRNAPSRVERIKPALPRTPCSFERIYFSRGNDADIYRERKALGAGLVAMPQGANTFTINVRNTSNLMPAAHSINAR